MSVERLRDPVSTPQEFMLSLELARPSNVHPLDFQKFSSEVQRDGVIGVYDQLMPENNGFYMPTDEYTARQKSGMIPNRMSFDVRSGLSIGREDSRNNVFFGALTLQHFDRKTDNELVTVAIKPFKGKHKERHLGQEVGMFLKLNEIGVDSPELLGIYKQEDTSYLITRFRSEVITLDSIDWKNLHTDAAESLTQHALNSLLELHRNGVFHGDALPRNLTVQPNAGAIWHVDLEHAVMANSGLAVLQSLKKDLRDFYNGTCDLTGHSRSYSHMVATVLEPYERAILKLRGNKNETEPMLAKISKLLPLICEEFDREFMGEPIKQYERDQMLIAADVGHTAMGIVSKTA